MITNAKLIGADYDPDRYHEEEHPRGDPGFVMSRSNLTVFAACPSRWKYGFKREDSDATDWGTLIDCLVLTPQMFEAKFAVKPAEYRDEKSGEMKKWNGNATVCKEWAREHEGLKLVSAEDSLEAAKAVGRLNADAAIHNYIASSARQVHCTAEWQDNGTGIAVPLKTLIDLVPDKGHTAFHRTLGDFKTARDAGLRGWSKTVHQFGYAIQAALELDIYNAATGESRDDFRHIIQENVPPYQTAKRILDKEFIEIGRDAYRMALAWYCHCLKTGEWPDYDATAPGMNGWAFVKPEAWMMKDA